MRRWKLLCLAACAAVLAATLFVASPRSSEAASEIKHSPGRLVVEGSSGLFVDMHNPTTKPVTVSVSFVAPTVPFTNTSFGPQTIDPGNLVEATFNCGAVSMCIATPVVTSSSKGLIVSANFKEDGGASFTHAHAGDWVTIK